MSATRSVGVAASLLATAALLALAGCPPARSPDAVHDLDAGADGGDDDAAIAEVGVVEQIDAGVSEMPLADAGAIATDATLRVPVRLPPNTAEIYFATDRGSTTTADGHLEFDANHANRVALGTCLVSTPHDVAEADRHFWSASKTDYAWQDTKASDDIFARVADDEAHAPPDAKDALVFVHGYNTSFKEACERAAKIKTDLGFAGPVFLFSWPSVGGGLRGVPYYEADLSAANSSAFFDLVDFLEKIQKIVKPPRLHLLAHSMGGQVSLMALQSKRAATAQIKLNQVLFAAPDVDADQFLLSRVDIVPMTEHVTVYVSDHDKALQVSKHAILHGAHDRLGLAPPITHDQWFDTIDASHVKTSEVAGFGHGYLFEKTMLNDVAAVLRGQPMAARTGWLQPAGSGQYYLFTKE